MSGTSRPPSTGNTGTTPAATRCEFTDTERALIHTEAEARRGRHNKQGTPHRNSVSNNRTRPADDDLYGAIGEYAVARHLGLQPDFGTPPPGIRNAADLPGNIEVKTARNHNHRLIVQYDDDPTKRFVLVTVAQTVLIRGWITGTDAMRDTYRDDPVGGRPAYFIPVDALTPIETLQVTT